MSSSPGPSGIQAISDESPILEWEVEKQEEFVSIFPTISPDYLYDQVQALTRVDGRLLQRNITKDLNTAFQICVERIWSMSPHQRSLLPTRSQWEVMKKKEAELMKWSGNMTPK